ncbi:type VI secretion system protein TssA [Anatilimnocola floriformis]|uniref:type VI secretion system protein TssA n=1 Tax=Anatilimnocola floriformis TaxID=2948575 RepID=UPI0020C4EB78|nr:type VI secretion system protein TssA [Anatilimnocola floriformis]
MPTPPVIDAALLLAPIPGDNPAGAALRSSAPEFDEINKLLPQQDKGVSEGIESARPGEWRAMIDKCSAGLKNKSKDLRFAGRLIQALTNRHGFAGLRDGLLFTNSLINEYWDTLNPLPDEDTGDLESRVSPLLALCRETEAPIWIREVPLTNNPAPMDGDDSKRVPVTYNLHVLINEKKSDSALPFAAGMAKVIGSTPAAFLISSHEDIVGAAEALEAFKDATNDRFGRDVAPDVTKVREALALCKNRIESICKSRGISLTAQAAVAETSDESESSSEETSTMSNGNGHAGPIRNRAEALNRLREIADFLKQAEPHSPVSYLINRAITWSEMPFEKLLLELVTDDAARERINTTLGIKPDAYGSSDSSYDSGSGYSEEQQ